MSRSKYGQSSLAGLVDSDEDEAQFMSGMPTPESGVENMAPAKKGRGKPKAAPAKVTKIKAPARRTSGRLSAKTKTNVPMETNGKRKALADKTNQQYASDTEEVEEFEQNDTSMDVDEVENKAFAVKATKPKTTKKTAAGRGKITKEVPHTNYSIDEVNPDAPRLEARVLKKKASAKEIPEESSPEKVVHETQAVDVGGYGEEEVEETVPKRSHSTARHRSVSRPRQPSVPRRRAGSASDTERSDPVLRRKLGEMTKKYDALNIKYQDLREIGLKEAERNFDRLKKQSEEKTKISNDLITSLKADVAAQTAFAKDSRGLKKKLDSQSTAMAALQAQVAQMTTSLLEAQVENKALSAKLAANRTAAASVESAGTKGPGSAVKPSGVIRMMGTAEAAQVAQAAQLKEDLYSDLTGLIIRSVKRESEEDVFDCIQTGRNGTLHFKLAVANEKSADSYDDAQCVYIPQLDPSRDKSLMELLPDYLVDEITFPRPQAAKFYARVIKALTEKVS